MKPQIFYGDTPCFDCKTKKNPIWYTDNTFWNAIMGKEKNKILCINCFILRAEERFDVKAWRVLPDWTWEEK